MVFGNFVRSAVLLILPGLALSVTAQTGLDEAPGRGVARLSVVNGSVSVQRGDSNDLIAGALNAPLVVQDRLITGPNSRAELQFDMSNMLRAGADTEVRITELDYQRYQMQIARGTVTFRVLRDARADIELSTPSIAIRPTKRGSYRISVRDDGSTEVAVRSGEVDVYTPRGSEHLGAGRTMLARGTSADPEFQYSSTTPTDDWDRWNESRDRDLERSTSVQYVSQDIYGAEDLDAHGRWVSDPEYGSVWSPRVAGGWVPYRNGRWSWIDYYGWTWVSYDPWGWAPYHYGRWYNRPGIGWCWYPGGLGVRHHWSPALVAFFGLGGINVGVGFGNVGWIPLAPRERYYPWYGPSYYRGYRNNTYLNNVTVVNNVNVTNIYRNARIGSAVTTVDGGQFGRGGVGHGFSGNAADLSQANVIQGALPFAPHREGVRVANQDVPVAVRPTPEGQRAFFTHRAPPAIERTSFDEQRRGIEAASRRTFGDSPSQPVASGPARLADGGQQGMRSGERTPASVPPTGAPESRGWQRFGDRSPVDRGATPAAAEHTRPAAAETPGREWHRFGSADGTNAQAAQPARVDSHQGDAGTSGERRTSGWQRFGTSAAGSPAPSVIPPTEQRENSGRRFGNRQPEQAAPPSAPAPVRESRPQFRGQQEGNPSRFEPRQSRNSEPVRINPPIVHERIAAPAVHSESRPAAPAREAGGPGRAEGGRSRR